uniref:Uncharacterized protein n=1 Tax=Salix viminalis TaxID=40686 RepID=A0A6N2KWQ9_SALVM
MLAFDDCLPLWILYMYVLAMFFLCFLSLVQFPPAFTWLGSTLRAFRYFLFWGVPISISIPLSPHVYGSGKMNGCSSFTRFCKKAETDDDTTLMYFLA